MRFAVGSSWSSTSRTPSRYGRGSASTQAVVFREGDYFGRTVNVAARIADYAKPREVLVSEDARLAADVEGVMFEEVGEIALKGVAAPVTLHRAVRA